LFLHRGHRARELAHALRNVSKAPSLSRAKCLSACRDINPLLQYWPRLYALPCCLNTWYDWH